MISVSHLSKTFFVHRKQPGLRGSLASLFIRKKEAVDALRDVNLQIGEGEIVGLVGANGAGKTTLVKILSGIIHPSAGTVSVLGHNPWQRSNEFRRRIALVMGQKAQLWWDLPAADCFLLLREIYGIDTKDFNTRLARLAETLEVTSLLTTQIRRLSLGERMKMELIATLLHHPRVVYLDEPTIGLDLSAQRRIRSFILEYRDTTRPAMIVTSHYMEDIRSLCRRIVILRRGSVVYDGSLDHIVSDHAPHKTLVVRLEPESSPERVKAALPASIGTITHAEELTLRVRVPRAGTAVAANHLFSRCRVADIAIEEPDISTIIESLLNEK